MNKLIKISLLCYVSFLVILLKDCGDAKDTRQKRYLSFYNQTKLFLRLNFKTNMIQWNQIFAQAIGFRMNWDDPPDTFRPYHHLNRRSVYNSLELLLDKNGFNGYHCVRRAICEMKVIVQPSSLYYKILKMVFRHNSSATDKWHNVTKEECLSSIKLCPISFLDVSLYTDV